MAVNPAAACRTPRSKNRNFGVESRVLRGSWKMPPPETPRTCPPATGSGSSPWAATRRSPARWPAKFTICPDSAAASCMKRTNAPQSFTSASRRISSSRCTNANARSSSRPVRFRCRHHARQFAKGQPRQQVLRRERLARASGLHPRQTATAIPREAWATDSPGAPPASAAAADGKSCAPAADSPRCAGAFAPNCRTAQTASASCPGHTDAARHRKSRAPPAPRPRKRTAPACLQAVCGRPPETPRGPPDAATALSGRPGPPPAFPVEQRPEQRGLSRLPRPEDQMDIGPRQLLLQRPGIPTVKHTPLYI